MFSFWMSRSKASDPDGAAAMKKWLRRFTQQGRTVFITSHVLDTVERFCDRVAVVTKPGRLLWEGDLAVLRGVGELMHEGKVFRSLESLFLSLTGESQADLAWL